MDRQGLRERVERYFVSGQYNCTMTALAVLFEAYEMAPDPRLLGAGQCMPGVGGSGGLCGLVSGTLIFLGVWGYERGLHRSALAPGCAFVVESVRRRFGSTSCAALQTEEGCGDLVLAYLEEILPVVRQVTESLS
jgi:hypothetical protein